MSSNRLKFRAWDGVKFYEPVYACGDWYRTGRDLEDGVISTGPVMQWTGLTDCNGVEIYEGDFVKVEVNSHYWVYLITTSSEQFGTMLFAIEQYSNLSIDEEDRYTFEITCKNKGARNYVPSGRSAKIIGNFYENPELAS